LPPGDDQLGVGEIKAALGTGPLPLCLVQLVAT
jgi:hypothetical protein